MPKIFTEEGSEYSFLKKSFIWDEREKERETRERQERETREREYSKQGACLAHANPLIMHGTLFEPYRRNSCVQSNKSTLRTARSLPRTKIISFTGNFNLQIMSKNSEFALFLASL